jgi:hypothetical protein
LGDGDHPLIVVRWGVFRPREEKRYCCLLLVGM